MKQNYKNKKGFMQNSSTLLQQISFGTRKLSRSSAQKATENISVTYKPAIRAHRTMAGASNNSPIESLKRAFPFFESVTGHTDAQRNILKTMQ